MAAKKINITIEEELLGQLDKIAKENYMTRSAYIAMAVVKQMKGDK